MSPEIGVSVGGRRSVEEIEQRRVGYRSSKLRRKEFCRDQRIGMSTLAGYLRPQKSAEQKCAGGSHLVGVELAANPAAPARQHIPPTPARAYSRCLGH